ncbi:MAG: hypothetical protein ABIP30_12000, partial [Ferruginibacter sp.]
LRELLYKNRELIAESSTNGKLLILTFADLMELYEQITATWYDCYHKYNKEYDSLLKVLKEVYFYNCFLLNY